MRNLKLRSRRSWELQGPGAPQGLAVHTDTGSLLLASPLAITETDHRTGQLLREVSLTADGFLPDDGGGSVVGLQDLAEQESVCVATAGGDVILCNLNTDQLECVGSVDSGLTSMSWSPDEELVILTTGQETIIMMTKDFEPITEVGIHQEDFGEGKFITVGWGKKETQFHGSEGKQAAQRKTLEVQPAVPWDDRRPRVTWRGDGQLFAVSAVCPQTGARKVRVWSRECVLQATSEAVNGLEQALCWKPSGSLIASTQQQPNKHSVVFMEKNGLLHGDFTLPFSRDQAKVKELLWNSDSTVLAVWLEAAAGEEKRVDTHIQLWTVGNYHWYLKQSLDFGSDPQRAPACVTWDPEHALRLHVVTAGWTAVTYDWSWSTERSAGPDADDNAGVAVIDGDKVLVTTFRQAVVPPPMCSFELQLTSPVNQVSFLCQPQRTNQLAALTADGQVAVFVPAPAAPADQTAAGFRTVSPPLVLQRTYRVSVQQDVPLVLRQLLWLQDDLFVAVSSGLQPSSSSLLLLRPDGSTHTLCVSSELELPGVVVGLVHGARSGTLAVQLEDGQTRKLLWDGAEPALLDLLDPSGCRVGLPVACVHTALCSLGGQEILLGLTDRSHLYAGDTQLASNVSSFVVYDDFLILTTHSHTCRCLQLSTLSVKGLQGALASDGGQNDETLRRVERGSRIVTVVPQDTRLILQMPRGNLETVHHRALVLAQLRKWLDSLRFREAFEVMRKLRINLNLIYDHNPQVFLENVESFVTQLDSVNHINLFLTELREEDTSRSMYPRPDSSSSQAPPPPPPPPPGVTKVDVVCDALRRCLEALDTHRFCLSILTTHVKKTVPELEVALQKVHELRVNPPGAAGAVSAEEALKYLLFLVNVNELYEHSLGTYDFDLVLMVAEKSQKDPKEYLPFLNMLKSLETNYQRFTIDRHLRRFRKALQHLSKCGEERFPEALQLIKEQKLFSEALRLYPAGGAPHKALSRAYADHLMEQQQPEQAGLLLWRCGEPAEALQAFVSGSSWRNAVSAAQQIPLPPPQLALLARQLAEKLMEQRRYSEAALLLDQYAKDCEEAIAALITGALWEEALRLIHMHDRQDITETDLKPALLEACGSQVSFLEAQAVTFSRHRARLAVVRQQKLKARLELLDDEAADCVDADLFSEASSVMTNSRYSHSNSRISSRSSKNRRKAERKKFSLKEGSPLEDCALLCALSDIISTVDKMREEVHGLLKALVLFQFDGQAQKLQLAYGEALHTMEAAVPEIWQDVPQQSQAPVTGPNSTANSITASFNQQKPAAAQPDAEILTPPKMRNGVKWKLAVLQ
ncbi:elongator complex protein 1 [Myripristis murdjan]|uniref:Elongator complex protein 1 n=1 Tax=Myripristis murdjan TaxID=586833 RepID=A0A667ZUC7_9TELE|nr:elongator complex protein 1 [Myripristis murdjan]XP_029917225.1 elongator complex protein 1 [Myripristis murdjan]XP_029917226.1 elongator complex protein 1 [Myripristis murdjan]XP_029917227.1 elongator complex protein 1 [Myripristis murdjan]